MFFPIRILSAVILPLVAEGHSWVVKVGDDGGRSRGGVVGSDHVLQRYFCPLEDLDACQPEAKHGIVLSDDALRPCRAGVTSHPMSHVAPGEDLFMSWMGNGHVNNGQSDDTCVRIFLTPYASDPSFDDFVEIGGCIDYWHFNEEGNLKTDTRVQIPAATPPGQYTVLWFWDFLPFYFSSCADIVVSPTGSPVGGPSPTTPPVPLPSTNYHQDGCADIGSIDADSFCNILMGGNSYCKSNQSDGCGRSVCHGDSFSSLDPCNDDEDSDDEDPNAVYNASGCTALPDGYCSTAFGTYCKDYKKDSCGRSVCQGGSFSSLDACNSDEEEEEEDEEEDEEDSIDEDDPDAVYNASGCTALPDDYCSAAFGTYCKDYKKDGCGRAVCQGGSHSALDPCP